jgi:hypothetical protein
MHSEDIAMQVTHEYVNRKEKRNKQRVERIQKEIQDRHKRRYETGTSNKYTTISNQSTSDRK